MAIIESIGVSQKPPVSFHSPCVPYSTVVAPGSGGHGAVELPAKTLGLASASITGLAKPGEVTSLQKAQQFVSWFTQGKLPDPGFLTKHAKRFSEALRILRGENKSCEAERLLAKAAEISRQVLAQGDAGTKEVIEFVAQLSLLDRSFIARRHLVYAVDPEEHVLMMLMDNDLTGAVAVVEGIEDAFARGSIVVSLLKRFGAHYPATDEFLLALSPEKMGDDFFKGAVDKGSEFGLDAMGVRSLFETGLTSALPWPDEAKRYTSIRASFARLYDLNSIPGWLETVYNHAGI